MSANQAAILADFRKRAVQVFPDDVKRSAQAIRRNFTSEQIDLLVHALADRKDEDST